MESSYPSCNSVDFSSSCINLGEEETFEEYKVVLLLLLSLFLLDVFQEKDEIEP